jgi:hypothetical protein
MDFTNLKTSDMVDLRLAWMFRGARSYRFDPFEQQESACAKATGAFPLLSPPLSLPDQSSGVRRRSNTQATAQAPPPVVPFRSLSIISPSTPKFVPFSLFHFFFISFFCCPIRLSHFRCDFPPPQLWTSKALRIRIRARLCDSAGIFPLLGVVRSLR